jgi:hypothetical protein
MADGRLNGLGVVNRLVGIAKKSAPDARPGELQKFAAELRDAGYV